MDLLPMQLLGAIQVQLGGDDGMSTSTFRTILQKSNLDLRSGKFPGPFLGLDNKQDLQAIYT
jgi:hypothetical protein